ncbi:MAG: DNA primase [bacterium]
MTFSIVNRLVSEQIPLDKVISRYVKLEPSSRGFKGLCPFHQEKTPSFHVNTVENFFYCFGCGASGNAITFLIMKEGFSFSEAVQKLGEEFGIPELMKKTNELDSSLEREREDVYKANEVAAKIFMELLEENSEAKEYLENRGVTPDIQKKFAVGFIGSGDRFVSLMKERGVGINTMMRAGLIKLDSSSRAISFFYNRIMVPIIQRNKVIGFGGRIFSGNGPKYINSPDTIAFNKGKNIFGIDFVRAGLKEFPFIVLCEGYFDVMAMHKNGFCTAVASLGTAITEHHLNTLERFNKPVVLLLDSDSAGVKAAKRISELKMPEKLDLRVAFIKEKNEDPDSILMKEGGATTIRDLVELSRPLFQELIDEQLNKYNLMDNLEEKLKIEGKIREITKNIPSRKFRTYAQYIYRGSGNVIRIYYDRNKKIAEQLAKAEKKDKTGTFFFAGESSERLKRLIVIASLYNEFVPALETVKDVFISSNLAEVYELIVKCSIEGESFFEISKEVDPEGVITLEFENKELSFIEKTFNRELSRIMLERNNELIKLLHSDDSVEALKKKWELTLENNKLKKVIKDIEITESNGLREN